MYFGLKLKAKKCCFLLLTAGRTENPCDTVMFLKVRGNSNFGRVLEAPPPVRKVAKIRL